MQGLYLFFYKYICANLYYSVSYGNSNERYRQMINNETVDYRKLFDYCDEMLRGYYPNSKRFTPILKKKMHDMLEEIGATFDEFDKGLALYEEKDEHGDAFSPSTKKLKKHILSTRGPSGGSPDEHKMIKYFAAMVKDHGWEEAHRRFSSGTADESRWIANHPIENKYGCFPTKYRTYLEIFFSGDIIGAQEYYIENSIKREAEKALNRELDNYTRIGNNNTKKSFMVFRPKVNATPKSLEQLKRFKLKGRLSKDRVQ